jgi:hypothetical protein
MGQAGTLLTKDVGNAVISGTRAWRQIDKVNTSYRETIMVQLGNRKNALPFWKDKRINKGPLNCLLFLAPEVQHLCGSHYAN